MYILGLHGGVESFHQATWPALWSALPGRRRRRTGPPPGLGGGGVRRAGHLDTSLWSCDAGLSRGQSGHLKRRLGLCGRPRDPSHKMDRQAPPPIPPPPPPSGFGIFGESGPRACILFSSVPGDFAAHARVKSTAACQPVMPTAWRGLREYHSGGQPPPVHSQSVPCPFLPAGVAGWGGAGCLGVPCRC